MQDKTSPPQAPQVILTWVSWSWKTTIMESLLKDFPQKFARPIQFTTREPRSNEELDSYVFLTKSQFYTKLENGDFMEFTEYNWELYAISLHFNPSVSNIFIVEPVWRASLKKHFHQNGIPYRGFYLEIDEKEVVERLMNRWDSAKNIEKRLLDFKYFHPEVDDKVLDATIPTHRNVEFIAKSTWMIPCHS